MINLRQGQKSRFELDRPAESRPLFKNDLREYPQTFSQGAQRERNLSGRETAGVKRSVVARLADGTQETLTVIKKKPAILFEVLNKAEPVSRNETGSELRLASEPAAPPAPLTVNVAPELSDKSPASKIQVHGGRLRLEVTPTGLALVVFSAGLIGLGGYFLGSNWGEKRGLKMGYLSANLASAETTSTLDPLLGSTLQFGETLRPSDVSDDSGTSSNLTDNSATGRARTSSTWLPGLNYIIIQTFKPDAEADAHAARRFLTEQGESAQVVLSREGTFLLIAENGYDFSSKDEKSKYEQRLARIQELGRQYFRGGGRYPLQGFPKKLAPNGF